MRRAYQFRQRGLIQVRLLTAIILMIEAAILLLVFMRQWAWIPESKAMTEAELEKRFPGWVSLDPDRRSRSPDGTRVFDTYGPLSTHIHDTRDRYQRPSLFDFTIRDHSSIFQQVTDRTPLHTACGFVDDEHCVMTFGDSEKVVYYRVWSRQFPEWWWGNLYRPEVWAACLLGLILIYKAWVHLRKARCTVCRIELPTGGFRCPGGIHLCAQCRSLESAQPQSTCPWCSKEFSVLSTQVRTGNAICAHCKSYVFVRKEGSEVLVSKTPFPGQEVVIKKANTRLLKLWGLTSLLPALGFALHYWCTAQNPTQDRVMDVFFGHLIGWGLGTGVLILTYLKLRPHDTPRNEQGGR